MKIEQIIWKITHKNQLSFLLFSLFCQLVLPISQYVPCRPIPFDMMVTIHFLPFPPLPVISQCLFSPSLILPSSLPPSPFPSSVTPSFQFSYLPLRPPNTAVPPLPSLYPSFPSFALFAVFILLHVFLCLVVVGVYSTKRKTIDTE